MKKLLLGLTLFLGLFALAACGGSVSEEQQLVDNARDALLLAADASRITSDINLPTAGRNGTTITWVSSNPSVVSNTGTVTRPEPGEGNAIVNLTATITLNESSATRTFEVSVVEMPESDVVKIVDALATPVGEVVTIRGLVTHAYQGLNRVALQDETGGIFLFGVSSFGVNIGDEIEVLGVRRDFNGLKQLDPVESITILSRNNPQPEAALIDFSTDLINYQNQSVRIEGLLLQENLTKISNTSGVNFNLVDEDGEVVIIFRIESEGNLGAEIRDPMVDLMNSLIGGESVTIDGGLVGWFNAPQIIITNVNQLNFERNELTDSQALAADIAFYSDVILFTAGTDLTLPEEGVNESVFTDWTSSHPELIANDGSFVASPDSPTVVTFTANATRGTETGTVEIKVDALAPISVTDALEVAVGRSVIAVGVVVSIDPHTNGFFIQDEDGTGIYVGKSGTDDLKSLVKPGDFVSVLGVRDLFDRFGNRQNQVWNANLIEVIRSGEEVFVFEGFTVDQIITDYPESDSKRFIVENVIIDSYDGFNHVFLTNSDEDLEMQIKFDIRRVAAGWELEDYPIGTELTLIFTTQRLDFDNYRVVDVVVVTEE